MNFRFTQPTKPAISRLTTHIIFILMVPVIFFCCWVLFPQNVLVFAAVTLLFLAAFLVYTTRENARLSKHNQLLATQQQFLSNAINTVDEAVIVTGCDTSIQYMNTVAEEITGKELMQVKDRFLQEIYKTENEKTGEPVENVVTRVLKTRHSVFNENNTVITNKNKQKIIITNSCSPVFDDAGNITGAVLVFKSTSKIGSTEKLLKTNETVSNNLIQHLPQAVYTCDKNGYLQSYNKAAADLWGRKPQVNKEKWCGSLKLFYADGTPVLHEDSPMALTVKQKKFLRNTEVIVQRPDGEMRFVMMHPAPCFNEDGAFCGAVNMLVDVTEKKHNDQLAAFNEDKYKTLAEQASEAIFITDIDGNLQEVNEQAGILTGYSKSELKRINITRLFPKNDFENNFIFFKEVAECNEKIVKEVTALHKNNSLLNVLISAKRLSDGRIMAIVKDVTEQKYTKKSLHDIEQLNASILTSVSSHIAVIDENGVVVTANRAWNDFREKYGKTVLERCAAGQNMIIASRLAAACGDKTAAVFLEGADVVLASKAPLFEYEYPCYVQNRLYWFLLRVMPFAGNASKLVLSHVDISERKNAENEIGNYRFALDQSSIVDVSDSNGIITYVNDNFCAVTGYQRHEVLGKDHKILNAGYHTADFYKTLWDTVTSGKVWTGEVQNRNKNGETFWVNTTIVPFLNTEGKPIQFISVRSDISLRKAFEAQMQSAVERFHFLSQATSDTIWDWDIEKDKVLYNEGVSKVFGHKKSEVSNVREWWQKCIHKADIVQVSEAISEAFAVKAQNLQLEYRFLCENGRYKYIYDRAFIIYNEEGKPYRMIGAMQDITYKKEEEHLISKAVVDAQEAERQYLGMELHDNINQLLTGTLLMLGAATHAPMKKEEIVKIVESCKQHLGSAVEEIRNLSHRLSPAAFTTSLQHEFVTLITEMSRSSSFEATHQFIGINEKLLAPEIKICLYRVLQEQLSNINKHSKAKHVNIVLKQNESSIILKITDDGIGFDLKIKNSGIGLGNIRKRTGYFSGKFTLNTAPGKGCCIEAELPLI